MISPLFAKEIPCCGRLIMRTQSTTSESFIVEGSKVPVIRGIAGQIVVVINWGKNPITRIRLVLRY